jgi:asparagine N-glycosylation enzyme membrane subunit Stt3
MIRSAWADYASKSEVGSYGDSPQWRSLPVSRRWWSFHRLGLGIAGTIIAVGLVLIGAALIRLDLLETLGADDSAVVAGFTLILLGSVAIAAYGIVRAIEWASRR